MAHLQELSINLTITVVVVENSVPVDISGATTKDLIFLKPGGALVSKNGTFVSDGTDGLLSYTTELGFLTPAGTWRVQCHVVKGADDYYTEPVAFAVDRNLQLWG